MGDLSDRIAGWLIGGVEGGATDDRRSVGLPIGANGLLSRMIQAFPDEPIGPGQQLNAGAGLVTLAPPDFAQSAVISVEVVSCRIKVDGIAPTTAVGLLVAAGTIIAVTGRKSMQGFQAIGTAAGCILDVQFFT